MIFSRHLLFALALMGLFWNWLLAGESLVGALAFPFMLAYLGFLFFDRFQKIRPLLLAFLLGLLVFSPFVLQKTDESFGDVPVAVKAATQFVLQGKNPYAENFSGTDLDKVLPGEQAYWNRMGQEYNALSSFVYFPSVFWVSAPFAFFFSGQPMALLSLALLLMVLLAGLLWFSGPALESFWIVVFLTPFSVISLLSGHVVDFWMLLLAVLFFGFYY
ncbi:MAG: hypothetical protein HY917_04290, partial [Candidatus Diapherotrites archaeon]|nr:hypothetical protein [Candidatus Diapherotrites archaeon]